MLAIHFRQSLGAGEWKRKEEEGDLWGLGEGGGGGERDAGGTGKMVWQKS